MYHNCKLFAIFLPFREGIAMSFVILSRVFILRSEEHTSELQSRSDLVCRLLLEKKKKTSVRLSRRCGVSRGVPRAVPRRGSVQRGDACSWTPAPRRWSGGSHSHQCQSYVFT